jgi:hypothetical protein
LAKRNIFIDRIQITTSTYQEFIMLCAKCKTDNPGNGKFCDNCGAALVQNKVCPKCKLENTPSSKYCDSCGFNFNIPVCPHCGTENQSGAKFCDNCGKSMTENIAAPKTILPAPSGVSVAPVHETNKIGGTTAKEPDISLKQVSVERKHETTQIKASTTISNATPKSPWGWVTLTLVSLLVSPIGCAILAGINWKRMEQPKRVWLTILSPSLIYILWNIRHPEFFSAIYWQLIINLIFGLGIWFTQQESQNKWKQQNVDSKKAGWQIPLLIYIIFGVLSLISIFFTELYII